MSWPRYMTKVLGDDAGNVAMIPRTTEKWHPACHKRNYWSDIIKQVDGHGNGVH
jgi:hypothetical protein